MLSLLISIADSLILSSFLLNVFLVVIGIVVGCSTFFVTVVIVEEKQRVKEIMISNALKMNVIKGRESSALPTHQKSELRRHLLLISFLFGVEDNKKKRSDK